MRMFYILILLALQSNLFAQSDALNKAIDIVNEVISTNASTSKDSLKVYLKNLEAIKTLKAQKSFSGKAIIGFNGETTRDEGNSLFNLFGGINLDWDLYPGELDFYTAFGVTYTDGKLQENVSRIDISYDYLQTNVSNGLLLENYVYINRTTDAYLGFDQRYELGGGIILNHWINRLIAPNDELLSKPIKTEQEIQSWNSILSDNSQFDEDDFDALQTDFKEAYNKNRVANSKLRLALLAGIFFELEKATVNDTYDLPTVYHFRWALRPTMDIHLRDGWKMSLRPYIKLPMPWEWQDKVVSENGLTSARADLLVDFSATLSTKLLSKRVEIGFTYNILFDNAPPRIYVEEDNQTTLAINNDLHQSFRMNMSISLRK